MAWGQRSQGIDDLLQRLQANDPKLQSITLMRQRKLDGAKDVARLCAALASNPHLTELSMSAHALDAASAQHLAGLLASPGSHLTTVSLGDSTFGDDAMTALCQGLEANTTLTSLDAEHKGLGPAAGPALAGALCGCTSLTTLQLGRNALGDAGLAGLCSRSWAGLRHLDLHDTGIGAAGLEALAACSGLGQLTSLSCAYNQGLDSTAAPHLERLVQSATRLVSLNLQHTAVGDAGAQAIATALQRGPRQQEDMQGSSGQHLKLTELDLAHTGLGDVGGVALAACLSQPSCPLTTLSLEGNRTVTDATVVELCQAASQPEASSAKAHQGLTSLNLSATCVSPACLEPLSQLPGLQHLSLLGCQLGTAGAHALTALTRQSPAVADAAGQAIGPEEKLSFPSLKDLGLSACGLDSNAVEVVLGALEQGALPGLVSVELGGNAGCQGDGLHERVEALRAVRPGLGVHWRAGDSAPT